MERRLRYQVKQHIKVIDDYLNKNNIKLPIIYKDKAFKALTILENEYSNGSGWRHRKITSVLNSPEDNPVLQSIKFLLNLGTK